MADEIKNAFDWWQRDYVNPLDPNSLKNPPHKPDGRTAGEVVQAAVDDLRQTIETGSRPPLGVRAISTFAVSPSTGMENGDTYDGLTLVTGDIVVRAVPGGDPLNGAYLVPASGSASRYPGYATGPELARASFFASEGTAAGQVWVVQNTEINIGVDDIDIQFSYDAFLVPDNSLSLDKIANIATDRLLGRDTTGTGDVETLTVSGGLEFTGSGGIRRSALTGDVTASAGNNATTIANDAVTFAKMQNIATDRLLGRDAASSGDVAEISVGGGIEFTGADGIRRSALTGDVTAPAGDGATTIANDVVTFGKMQNIATDRLIGRDTSSSGDPEEISVGGGIEFTGSGGIGIANDGVTNTKLANMVQATIKLRQAGGGTGDPEDGTGDQAAAIIAPDVNFADLPAPGSTIQFRRVDGEYLAYSADGKWISSATDQPIVPDFVREGMEDAYVSANFVAGQYFNNWPAETNKTQATLADFFTAAGGTFTRAHTAKYYSGLATMAEAASGAARIQYDPGSGTALGLLIEGSFTNIANYSEAIAGGNGYVYTNVTVTANAAVAPDGTTTMDRIHASVAGGVAAAHNVAIPQQAFTSGQYYTMSVYVAAAGVTSVRLRLPTQAFASNNATFTLSGAGSISDNYGSAAKIENVGSGRYRLTITQASNASNTAYPTLLLGSADFIGDSTSGVDAWGFMIYNDRGHRMYYPALTASDAAFAGETLTFSRGIPADGATVLIRIVVPDIDASQTLWYWVESANSFIRLYIESGTLKFRVRQDASTIPIDATMGVVTAGDVLEVIARVQEGAYRVQRADTGFVITGSTSHVPSSATFWLGGNSSSVGLEAPIAEWVISPPKTDRQMSDIIGVTDSGGEGAGYEFATEIMTYTSTIQPVGNGITNGSTTNFNPLSMRVSYNDLGMDMIPLVVMHGWSEDYDVSGIYPALHEQFTLDDRVVIAVGMRGNAAGNDSTGTRYPWRDGGRNEIQDIFDALEFVRATLNARKPGMVNTEFAGIVGYSGGGGNVTSVLGHTDNTIFQFGADHFGIKLYGNAAYAGNATLGGWWEQSVLAGANQRLRQLSDATLGTRTAAGTPVVGTPTTNPNAYMMSDNRSALVANLTPGQKIAFFHAPSDASVQYAMTLATTNALDAASKTALYYANISEDWVHGYPDGFAQDSHPYWNPIFNDLIEAGLTLPATERTGVRVNGFWYSKRLKIQLVNNDASRTPEPIHVATAAWNLLTRVITLTKVSTTNANEPNAGTFIAMIDLDGNRTEVTLTGTATTTIQMKLGGGHIVL